MACTLSFPVQLLPFSSVPGLAYISVATSSMALRLLPYSQSPAISPFWILHAENLRTLSACWLECSLGTCKVARPSARLVCSSDTCRRSSAIAGSKRLCCGKQQVYSGATCRHISASAGSASAGKATLEFWRHLLVLFSQCTQLLFWGSEWQVRAPPAGVARSAHAVVQASFQKSHCSRSHRRQVGYVSVGRS